MHRTQESSMRETQFAAKYAQKQNFKEYKIIQNTKPLYDPQPQPQNLRNSRARS
jgi:hypothetical protein